jgi:hypothetical protein
MLRRRLLPVPAEASLRALHGILQAAMGWEGIHLFQFRLRAVRCGSWPRPRLRLAHDRRDACAIRERSGHRNVRQRAGAGEHRAHEQDDPPYPSVQAGRRLVPAPHGWTGTA